MDGLKESKQAVGAEATLPASRTSRRRRSSPRRSRLNFSTRLFNLLVTNIPGPQLPLYVLGRELEDVFPVAFLPEDHALAVAIMSYNGALDFGLLGDFDAHARHRVDRRRTPTRACDPDRARGRIPGGRVGAGDPAAPVCAGDPAATASSSR